MYKTIENQLRKHTAPAAIRAEFRQHDFDRLRGFCLLVFCLSIAIWVLFDLLLSFIGGQGFTYRSMLLISGMCILTVVLLFVRKADHFSVLNLLFVSLMAFAVHWVVDDTLGDLQAGWLIMAASSILYSFSVLPVRRWSYFASALVTWLLLNPFQAEGTHLLDLRGLMIISYAAFITGLTFHSYSVLRESKLQNFYMSRLLLDQAYIDVLTEIPNRRSFMTQAEQHLGTDHEGQGRYLAMIDIDNFKRVNDQFGHDSGDVVLKRIAANIKASMNEFVYARLGGEEFVIYLWGLDQQATEERVAALCALVRETPGEHPVTISIGLTRIEPGDNLSNALGRADAALYDAKHEGKDRYVVWRAPDTSIAAHVD
ncbi:GGDEF domain-containing protein [Pseudomonas sp. Marseille-P9899]|uniref:GGDEF domain-containing protein n=1 Tax=Pseudomonas sp. Marseille-P9899 TaxID=2730401 RepID=UPI00158A1D71|nr:GGDEF domain-containing protein [Pseudomonas sp. Marseille-P9899]